MANSLRKVANYLGLMDDPEEDSPKEIEVRAPYVRPVETKVKTREMSVPSHGAGNSLVAMQLDLPVLDRIVTIHPRFYNEARTLGEHYRLGNPVIMNLSDMEENERKRLVDFASGLVFGHHGTIERVTSKVFLLSPANIRVSSEDKAAAAEASFFNQS